MWPKLHFVPGHRPALPIRKLDVQSNVVFGSKGSFDMTLSGRIFCEDNASSFRRIFQPPASSISPLPLRVTMCSMPLRYVPTPNPTRRRTRKLQAARLDDIWNFKAVSRSVRCQSCVRDLFGMRLPVRTGVEAGTGNGMRR